MREYLNLDIGPMLLDEAVAAVREALEVRDLRVGEAAEGAAVAFARSTAATMGALRGRGRR